MDVATMRDGAMEMIRAVVARETEKLPAILNQREAAGEIYLVVEILPEIYQKLRARFIFGNSFVTPLPMAALAAPARPGVGDALGEGTIRLAFVVRQEPFGHDASPPALSASILFRVHDMRLIRRRQL